METSRRIARSLIALILCITTVFCLNPTYAFAYRVNSYDYLAQGLDRPDMIDYAKAKAKGHVKRVLSMENEHSFVFENLDGTLTAYSYDIPVQAKGTDGKLHEIDLDFYSQKDSKSQVTSYKLQGDKHSFLLPTALGDGQSITLDAQDFQISMVPIRQDGVRAEDLNSSSKSEKVKDYYGKVVYSDVFERGVGLTFGSQLNGLKEDIVLSKSPKSNTFSYRITAPGSGAELKADGTVEFFDTKTLAQRCHIPAPYAIDSYRFDRQEGDGHDTDAIKVTMLPTGEANTWIYSLTVDRAFLDNPTTVYPVYVDPTFTINSTPDQLDSYIASGTLNTNYYNNDKMFVGKDGTLLVCRGLVNFNLTNFLAQDPFIVSAATYHTEEFLGYTSTCYVQTKQITSSWTSSTVTWANQPSVTAGYTDSKLVNGAGSYSFDVTSLVQGWLLNAKGAQGGFAKNGFEMVSDREGSVVLRKFRSSENVIADRPYLEITFTSVDRVAPNPPTGLTPSKSIDPTYSGTVKLTCSWTAATDLPTLGGTGIKEYRVTLQKQNGSNWDTLFADQVVTATTFTTSAYYDDNNTYRFTIRAVDKALEVNGTPINNVSDPVYATIAVPDCEKPAVNSVSISPAGYTSASSVALNWNVTEPSGLSKLEYWFGSESTKTTLNSPSVTGSTTVSVANLTDGNSTLNVRFTDTQQNPVTVTASNPAKIDRTVPTLSTTFNQSVVGDSFTLPMAFGDNLCLHQVYVEYGIGSSPTSYTQIDTKALSGTSDSWSNLVVSTTGWSDGQLYTVRVRVTDEAGNSSSLTRAVTRDSTIATLPADQQIAAIASTVASSPLVIQPSGTPYPIDVLIDGKKVASSGAGQSISIPLFKPQYPEGCILDLVVRGVLGSITGRYNVSHQVRYFQHGMDISSNLTLDNTSLAIDPGKVGIVAGFNTGTVILTVPSSLSGAQMDGVLLSATASTPAGASINYAVYDSGLATWVTVTPGTWCYLDQVTSELKIRATLNGTTSARPFLDALYLNYSNIVAGQIHTVQLLQQVAGLSAKLVDGAKAQISWTANPSVNGIAAVYDVYRGTSSGFTPDEDSLIGSAIADISYIDTKTVSGQTFYYKVRPIYPNLDVDGATTSDRAGIDPTVSVSMTTPDILTAVNMSGIQPLHESADITVNGASDFADLFTGNLNLTSSDLFLTGWDITPIVQRSYNSRNSLPTVMGTGWDHALDLYLLQIYSNPGDSTPSSVVFKDSQGTFWSFVVVLDENEAISEYTAPQGCPYSLKRTDGEYILTDVAQLDYRFNSALRVSSISDWAWLQEVAVDGVPTSVDMHDHLGNIDWSFTVVRSGGVITGYTSPQGCPYTLSIVDEAYLLTKGSETFAFGTDDTADSTQTLDSTDHKPVSTMDFYYTNDEVIFGSSGNLYMVSNPGGKQIYFEYDSAGRLIQVLNQEDREVDYHYNTAGLLDSVKVVLGGIGTSSPTYAETKYEYDSSGCLASVVDPAEQTEQFVFDSQKRLVSHSALYSEWTDSVPVAQTQRYWRQLTQISYVTNATTVGTQMRRSSRAPNATSETLDETVMLKKQVYGFSSSTGLLEQVQVFGSPVLIANENGLDIQDYTYSLVSSTSYSYTDTDSDGIADNVHQVVDDNDSLTPNLVSDSPFGSSGGYGFQSSISPTVEGKTYLYDLMGRLIAICPDAANHGDAGHVCEQYEYSSAGRVTKETTAQGLVTEYTYNSSGRVCRTEHPDGHVSTSESTFVNGRFVIVETDYGLNYVKTSEYDTLYQLVHEEIQSGGEWLSLDYSYNGLGQKSTQTDKNGNVTHYTYDASGMTLTETIDQPSGPDLTTTNVYNTDHALTSQTDPYGNVTTYTYETTDDKRLLTKTTTVNGENTVEAYDYIVDTNGNHILTTTWPDATQTVTTLDGEGRTDSISKPVSGLTSGTSIAVGYIYNASTGQLEKISHNGFQYVFTRNDDGDITGIAISDGNQNSLTLLTRTVVQSNDGSSSEAEAYANGQTVTLLKDAFGRPTAIQYNDGTTTTNRYVYTYGSANNTPTDLDGQEITSIQDDSSGRVTTSSRWMDALSYHQDMVVTDLTRLVTLYSMSVANTENAIAVHTDIGGTEQDYVYSKDDSERLYSTTYNLPGSTGVEKEDYFSTNGYGQLTGSTLKINGTTRLQKDYTYRTVSGVAFTGQVASESIALGSNSASYGYTYDNMGNITRIQKTLNSVTSDLFRYQYDEAGQLIREDDITSDRTSTWQYDAGGNIRFRRVFPLTAAGTTPDPQSMTDEVPYLYSTGIWKDQLTSYDGQSIIYDSMGNPTTYLGATLTWTMGRKLASYSKDGTTILYTYNDQGIRTSKTVNGVRTDYYLNGTQVLAEVTNGSRIDYRYDGNGKLIALRWNGNEYYYVTNLQGDVIGLIDGSGASVVEYSYDAWGNATAITGTMASTLGQANPYRYRGYRYDAETDMYYLQSRFYNPTTSFMMNCDDIFALYLDSSSIFLYVYCNNNPINKYDPTGNTPDQTWNFTKLLFRNLLQVQTWKYIPIWGQLQFYYAVKMGGMWDYKYVKGTINRHPLWMATDGKFIAYGINMTDESLGNLNYGFTGAAMGFSPSVIYSGGGYVAISSSSPWRDWVYYFDSEDDHFWIAVGILLYANTNPLYRVRTLPMEMAVQIMHPRIWLSLKRALS